MSHEQAMRMLRLWPEDGGMIGVEIACVFALLCAISSYFSWRFLRGLPDFEEKRAMLWGAKWTWAVLLFPAVGACVIAYAGVTRTPYPLTSLLAATALQGLLFAVPTHLVRNWVHGSCAAFALLRARLKRDQFDFDRWLAGLEVQRRQHARGALLMAAAALAAPLFHEYPALFHTYRVERDMVARYGPTPLVFLVEDALRSAEPEIVRTGRSLWCEPFDLVVQLRSGATDREADAILRQTERALLALGEPREWRIDVVRGAASKRREETVIVGLYSPPLGAEGRAQRAQASGRAS